jgi:predicted TIM-barrel fold metal-dependent hydrolase
LQLQQSAPEDEAAFARLQHPPAEYFPRFYADTSGQSAIAIRAALEFLGPEHMLLGSDAPYVAPLGHLTTVAQLRLPPEQYALLVGGNAERMLGLPKGANT